MSNAETGGSSERDREALLVQKIDLPRTESFNSTLERRQDFLGRHTKVSRVSLDPNMQAMQIELNLLRPISKNKNQTHITRAEMIESIKDSVVGVDESLVEGVIEKTAESLKKIAKLQSVR